MPAFEPRLPQAEELGNASEVLARMRIHYPGAEAAQGSGSAKPVPEGGPGAPEGVEGTKECQTCARRKYQDGSDDPGVSFKTPTTITPGRAPAAVMGHEQEHVVRERAEAEREGRKVVSQSVSIHTDICPECGRVFVSGGETRTVTADDNTDEMMKMAAEALPGAFAGAAEENAA